jgi:hypothetical protein
MGELHSIGTAFAILAVMMHGPECPTEISQHKARERIFMAAAKYALTADEIKTIMGHKEEGDKIVYYHGLLTTGLRPITLLYNDARDFFQNKVFLPGKPNSEYMMHLGLSAGQTVFQQ